MPGMDGDDAHDLARAFRVQEFGKTRPGAIAIDKGASTLLAPVSSRKQLNDLPDDLVTKIAIIYYSDVRDALLKALLD